MPKISEEIEKLDSLQVDVQLQRRLAAVNKQMKGLDSSTEKYNKLVKEVLNIQIKQLESEKRKLKEAKNLEARVSAQKNIRAIENSSQDTINSIARYKLDPKANTVLKNKVSVTTIDIEKAFEEMLKTFEEELSKLGRASVNISKKDLVRIAKLAKQGKQQQVYYDRTGTTPKTNRSIVKQEIARAEIEKLTKNEKLVAKELKDAILEVRDEIDRSESKSALEIQNKKLELLIDLFEKNDQTFKEEIAKELEDVLEKTIQESSKKEKSLKKSKFDEIDQKAEQAGVFQKLNRVSGEVVNTLGKMDSELGDLTQSIFDGIAGIYSFAKSLNDLPKKIDAAKSFFGGIKSLFKSDSKDSVIDSVEKEIKVEDLTESIDQLGKKITSLNQQRAEVKDKVKFGSTKEKEKSKSESLKEKLKSHSRSTENVTNPQDDKEEKKSGKKLNAMTSLFGIRLELSNKLMKAQTLVLNSLNLAFGGWIFKLIKNIKNLILGILTLNKTLLTNLFSGMGQLLTNLIPLKFITGFKALTKGLLVGGKGLIGVLGLAVPLFTGLVGSLSALVPLIAGLAAPIGGIITSLGLLTAAIATVVGIAAIASVGKGGAGGIPSGMSGNQSDSGGIPSGMSGNQSDSGGNVRKQRSTSDILSTPDDQLSPKERKIKQREQRKAYLRPKNKYLGEIAAQSESGDDGSRIGREATGHNSYGMYQIHHNNMGDFMKGLDPELGSQLMKSGSIGSPEFNAKWKEIGNTEQMRKAQQEYIEKTHYHPLLDNLANDGKDLSGRGKGLQELLFSTSVQEGSGTKTIQNALKGKDIESMSDNDIINAISEYKKANVGNKFRTHISSGGETSGIYSRIEEEKQTALSYETNKLKDVRAQNVDLQMSRESQNAMNSIRGINPSQAPIVLSQNNIPEDNTKENQWGPLDLRNLESTFIRNMDRDYALIR